MFELRGYSELIIYRVYLKASASNSGVVCPFALTTSSQIHKQINCDWIVM